jgi:hypothetical protein
LLGVFVEFLDEFKDRIRTRRHGFNGNVSRVCWLFWTWRFWGLGLP